MYELAVYTPCNVDSFEALFNTNSKPNGFTKFSFIAQF